MKSGTSVAPSPFNAVKLELALILVLSGVLLFVVSSIIDEFMDQLLLLGSFGGICMLWLVIRIRYILIRGSSNTQSTAKQLGQQQNLQKATQKHPTP